MRDFRVGMNGGCLDRRCYLASWKVHRVQSRWLSVCLLKGGDLL